MNRETITAIEQIVSDETIDEVVLAIHSIGRHAPKIVDALADVVMSYDCTKIAETIAKISKKLIDAHVAEGFTREEAVALTISLKELLTDKISR